MLYQKKGCRLNPSRGANQPKPAQKAKQHPSRVGVIQKKQIKCPIQSIKNKAIKINLKQNNKKHNKTPCQNYKEMYICTPQKKVTLQAATFIKRFIDLDFKRIQKLLKKGLKNIVRNKKGCKFAAAKNGNGFSKKLIETLCN